MSLNSIILQGRLCADPTLRRTTNGKAVASFTLAVARDFDKEKTDFVDCVSFGATAEFISKYFSKGRMAALSGRLQMRDWTDNNGNKRRNAEVIVDNIYFSDSKPAENAQSGYDNKGNNFNSYNANADTGDFDGFEDMGAEDDLPF